MNPTKTILPFLMAFNSMEMAHGGKDRKNPYHYTHYTNRQISITERKRKRIQQKYSRRRNRK